MRAQDIPFALKASVYGGYILPMTKNLEAVATPPALGGEIAVEFPAMGNYAWQRYWGMPTVGVGFVGMDLGNKAVLGQAFALYPYLLVPIVKRDHFHLNYKIGAGISLFTKTWNRGQFGHRVDTECLSDDRRKLRISHQKQCVDNGRHRLQPHEQRQCVATQ